MPEEFFPLDVNLCLACHFLQLGHVVSPRVLFQNYLYVSSTSPVFVAHFKDYARSVVRKLSLPKGSLVIDIGSNDGILLKPMKTLGMRVVGVEPAGSIARRATRDGIPTISQFFTPELARTIRARYGSASVISANNVFAHIDNLDDVLRGVDALLDARGALVIEAPYLVDFFEKNYFDLVYHEHLSYISIGPLLGLFQRFAMEVFDVEKTDVHGGSVRIWVQKRGGPRAISPGVGRFLALEKKRKLDSVDTYTSFAQRVLQNKVALLELLTGLKQKDKDIAAYGAPAKGNTLLNYFGIGTDYLDFVVDDSPLKQGLFTPGRHIPVVGMDVLRNKPPAYLLILAWNFAAPIMKKLSWYKEGGGKFILPVPSPKVL